MKKAIQFLIFSFIFLFISASVWPALAFTAKSGDKVLISQNDVGDGNLYVAGQSVRIEANLTGDVYCAGQNVIINGNVDGDVLCAGQTIQINGDVTGSIRIAGQTLTISSQVGRSAIVLGQQYTLGQDARISGENLIGVQNADIEGQIGRDLYGGGQNINIFGTVGRNINLEVERLRLGSMSKVGGDLNYTSSNRAEIANGSIVSGKNNFKMEDRNPSRTETRRQGDNSGRVLGILSSLLIGLVLIALFSPHLRSITTNMRLFPLASIGWGIVLMFVTPIVALIIAFTFIGLPIAFIIFVLWIVGLLLSQVITAIAVGQWLLAEFWKSKAKSLIIAALIGIPLTFISFTLPVIGGLLTIIAMWYGLGGLFTIFRNDNIVTPKEEEKEVIIEEPKISRTRPVRASLTRQTETKRPRRNVR